MTDYYQSRGTAAGWLDCVFRSGGWLDRSPGGNAALPLHVVSLSETQKTVCRMGSQTRCNRFPLKVESSVYGVSFLFFIIWEE